MKKKLSIVAAAGCALALAAPATADQTIKYKGKADPGGRVSFKLVKGGGKKQIDKFKWTKIPVDCGGKGDQTTSNKLGFTVKVKSDKTFSTKAVLGPSNDPQAKVKIEGSIAGEPGRRACVMVGPPLSARGASIGLAVRMSLGSAVPQPAAPKTLPPPELTADPAYPQSGPEAAELPATTELVTDAARPGP
jgi:hypothetical protein